MSFGAIAASYFEVASNTLPDPLLSFGFNEGSGNSFSPTHGYANTYAGGGAIEWGASLAGHGSAVVRTEQDTFTQTLTASYIVLSDGLDGWSVSSWTALSVMCWYRPMEMTYGASRVPFLLCYASEIDWMGIVQHPGGTFEAWLGNDNTSPTTTTVADDTWAHLALVWDGATLSFYIDAILAESRSTTELPGELDTIKLNGVNWSHSGGAVDDFRLFNLALTPEQIAAFMAEGV